MGCKRISLVLMLNIGFRAIKHKTFVGTQYFDMVQDTVQQGLFSTVAYGWKCRDSTVLDYN